MRRSTALTAALLLLAAAYMSIAIAAYVERSEEETRRMFRDWMAKVDKTYDSIGEKEYRYAVFKENLRRFDKQEHSTSVDAAGLPNGFGDLTMEELRSRKFCGTVITTKDKEYLRSLNLGWIEKVKRWIEKVKRFNFQLGPHN